MGVAENMLQESCLLKSGMASPDWHGPMFFTHLRKHLWLYCPGHGGVKEWPSRQTGGQGNLHKRLASLKIGSVEELKTPPSGLMSRTSPDQQQGRLSRGKRNCSTIFLEHEDWNCFKHNVGNILRDGVESIWAILSAYIPSRTKQFVNTRSTYITGKKYSMWISG